MILDIEEARAARNPYYVHAQQCEDPQVRIIALTRAYAEDPQNSILEEDLGDAILERLESLGCPAAYFGSAVFCFFRGDNAQGHMALRAMRERMDDDSYLPLGLSLLLRVPSDPIMEDHIRAFFDACVERVIDGADVHPYLVEAAERLGVQDLEQRLEFAQQRRRFR